MQKLAASNSNVATRHILQAQMYLTLRACENISLRVADSLQFPFTRQSLMNSISTYNTETLSELANLNMHDFGIFLNLEPDEEAKEKLEENIQVALKSGQINLEDAIDIREVRNIQLANQFLKFRRKKKAEADQKAQQANIQRDKDKEEFIEDRKDKRTRISGTQQSQMIDQRKNNLLPSDFETTSQNNMNNMGIDPLMS